MGGQALKPWQVSPCCGDGLDGRQHAKPATHLVVIESLPGLCLIFCRYANELILVQRELSLRTCAGGGVQLACRGRGGCGRSAVGDGEARLRHLEIAYCPLPLLLVLHRLDFRELVLRILAHPGSTLQFLLLREEICERALAAEEVAALAGDRVSGDLEAQATGAEGEERLAVEAGGVGAPIGLGDGALVRSKDGARRVPFTCEKELLSVESREDRGHEGRNAYCVTLYDQGFGR